jgi:hypothetical protein
MTAWTTDELDRIGAAEELEITTTRADGSPRRRTPIWVVRVGDELFVRSYLGADGAWYRHANAAGQTHIGAGGVERDVTIEGPGDDVQPAIDAAYRSKYARHGDSFLQPMVAAGARAATLRLTPRRTDHARRALRRPQGVR